jgi:mannosyltransferase
MRARLSWQVIAASLAVLLLVSLWLRTRSINAFYWVDEGISLGIAGHPLRHIPALLRQDGSPPLYYLLLHLWMDVRGRGEVATHELSLLFALISVPVAYWAGATLFDRLTGLVCALLAAGAPYLTVYAQETRMYTLLALLTLVVAASFVHAFVLRHRRYLPVFALSLTACLYTHNWSLFLGLMCGVAWLICLRRSDDEARRSMLRDGLMAFGAVAVLYAPWVPTLIYQAGHTGAPWDLPPVIWSLSHGAYSLVGGRGAAVALLLAGGSGLIALRRSEPARSALPLAALTLLVLGVGTLLVAWLYAKITPAWADRYLAVIVGPLVLLFGIGIVRAGNLGAVALALVLLFWILAPVPASRSSKSNVAPLAARFSNNLDSGSLVLSTQPEQVPVLSVYLPRVSHFATPIGAVSDPHVVDWRNALSRLQHAPIKRTLTRLISGLAPGERVLLVTPLRLKKSPLWMVLIQRYSGQWERALRRSSSLKPLAVSSAGQNVAGVPLRATLFVKQ